MSVEIKLPELGEGVTEGELIKWLVKPGDSIKADQSIAEIMTDKATVEVPSPKAGIVKELKFKSGDVVKVEAVMITLEAANNSTAASTKSTTVTQTQTHNQTHPSNPSHSPTSNSSSVNNNTSDYSVKLPELGEGVSEGELVKWLVKPGDTVTADQSIAEIMTDKATVEVPSPKSGVVSELKFKVGEIIKVDSTMIILKTSGTVASSSNVSSPNTVSTGVSDSKVTHSNVSAQAHSSSTSASIVYPPVMDSKVLATPSTRRLARELSIDLNGLSGSGLAGRVTREDVMKASPSQGSSATVQTSSTFNSSTFKNTSIPAYGGNLEERVAIKGIRKKIAENMQMAKAIIPHFTLMDEVDVTELVQWRDSLKETAEKQGTKITYLPFVMKALIATIKEFPMFNASIDDAKQEIVYKKFFNIGFAADTPNGLVVPVIKNADQKTLLQISKEILDLSMRARDNKLKPDEMKGATITVTNIGSVGGTYATPIINHPEVAILGMYKIQDRLYLDANGVVKNQKIMNYTITADHRLIDGAVAARFLKSFLSRIQKPSILMLDMQ